MTSGDFNSRSAAYGLKEGEFDDLDPKVKKRLLKLMSRISEMSYRRGAQHGAFLIGGVTEGQEYERIAKWRFRSSLDRSVGVDGRKVVTDAMKRLFIEYKCLSRIGFGDVIYEYEKRKRGYK